jgi:hypothetical protein
MLHVTVATRHGWITAPCWGAVVVVVVVVRAGGE